MIMKRAYLLSLVWTVLVLLSHQLFAQYTGVGFAGGVANTRYSVPSPDITNETGVELKVGNIIDVKYFDIADATGADLAKDEGVTFQIYDGGYTDVGGGDIRGYDTTDPATTKKDPNYVPIRFNGGPKTWRRGGKWARYSIDFAAGDYNFVYRGNSSTGFSKHTFKVKIYRPSDMQTPIFEKLIDISAANANEFVQEGATFNNVTRIGGGNSQTDWFRVEDVITMEAGTFVLEIDDIVANQFSYYGEFAFPTAAEVVLPTEPEVTITKPLADAYVWDEIQIEVNTFDPAVGTENGDGVVSVMYQLKNSSDEVVATRTTTSATSPWVINTIDEGHEDGAYTVTAKTTFESTTQVTSEPVTFNIKNTPAVAEWVTPVKANQGERTDVSGEYTVEVTAYDPTIGTTNGDGVSSILFQFFSASGGTAITSYTATAAPYQWVFNTADYANGDYQFKVGVRPENGKTVWSSNNVSIANYFPSASFVKPSENEALYGNIELEVNAYDPEVGNNHGDGVNEVAYVVYDNSNTEVVTQTVTDAPYKLALNTTTLDDGNYSVKATVSWVAQDKDAVETTTTFSILNATSAEWSNLTANDELSASFDFVVNANASVVGTNVGDGVKEINYVITNSSNVEVVNETVSQAPFSYTLNTTTLDNGSYTVKATVSYTTMATAELDAVTFTINNVVQSLSDVALNQKLIKQVYPNPFNSKLNIVLDNMLSQTTIELLDLTGKILYTKQLGSANTIEIPTHYLSKGIYILKVSKPNNVQLLKVIK